MTLVDLLLPLRCAACGVDGAVACNACLESLWLLRPPLCARCGAPTAWPVARCRECSGRRLAFRSARSAIRYEGSGRLLVAAWKERGLRRLTSTFAALVVRSVDRPAVQALAFVPGDGARTAWRGRNPPEVLAEALAETWGLPLTAVLARAGPAPRQAGRSAAERRANVRDRFRCQGEAPASVVLVDDVYTTGATVAAAASELRRAGARTVDVITLARAVRR